MHWKIYYNDRSTFSSLDGDPEDAPTRGVQVIAQDDPRLVWVTQAKSDYYIWDDRGDGPRFWGVDLFGLWEYLFTKPGKKIALAGMTIGSFDYDEIWRDAVNDPMFGRKATFARDELRPDD